MNYIVKDDEFGFLGEKNLFHSCGKDIKVLKFIKNCDTNEYILTVAFLVGNDITKKEVAMDSKLMDSLANIGYLGNKQKESHLHSYIDQQLLELKCRYVHTCIGWYRREKTLGFNGYKSIGFKNVSVYRGKLDIKPKGEISNFVNDYDTIIKGNVKLEFAIVMGLSSCMVGYLNAVCDESIDSLIFNINGGSSTGKTTISKLAVSMCGNPFRKDERESLLANCSTTKNAMVSKLNRNNGFFVVFDELGRLEVNVRLDDSIYQLADGTGKARCNKRGEIMDTYIWNTSIAFTGELSLLELTANKDGLNNRIYCFDNIQWTESAAQVSEVEEFAVKYSGLPIHELAKYLLKADSNTIKAYYREEIKRLQNLVPVQESFKNRTAKRAAILTTTVKCVSEALGISINAKAFENFLFSNGFQEFQNEYERAYSYFLSKFYENPMRFQTKRALLKENPSNLSNSIGYYCFADNNLTEITEVVITVEAFGEWMKEGRFSNIRGILRKWREAGLLKSQSDRLAESRVISCGGKGVKTYKILIHNDVEEKQIMILNGLITLKKIWHLILPKMTRMLIMN